MKTTSNGRGPHNLKGGISKQLLVGSYQTKGQISRQTQVGSNLETKPKAKGENK